VLIEKMTRLAASRDLLEFQQPINLDPGKALIMDRLLNNPCNSRKE